MLFQQCSFFPLLCHCNLSITVEPRNAGPGQNVQYIGVSTFQGLGEFIAIGVNNGNNAVSLLPHYFKAFVWTQGTPIANRICYIGKEFAPQ